MARFEDLAVWKRSARLSAELYKSLRDLKDFGFRDQITRAGLSIPSNIAEGYERDAGMKWIKEAEEISRMLHGLMQTIRTEKT